MGQYRKAAAEQLLGSQATGESSADTSDQRTPETTLVRLQDLVGQGLSGTIKPRSVVRLRSQLPAAIA